MPRRAGGSASAKGPGHPRADTGRGGRLHPSHQSGRVVAAELPAIGWILELRLRPALVLGRPATRRSGKMAAAAALDVPGGGGAAAGATVATSGR